jgi:hypothetical protein
VAQRNTDSQSRWYRERQTHEGPGKEILVGEHEKVQGGYGKYQGTWINYKRGVDFCRQYGVEGLLRPLLSYDMGQDGISAAGQGGIEPQRRSKQWPLKERGFTMALKTLDSLQAARFQEHLEHCRERCQCNEQSEV